MNDFERRMLDISQNSAYIAAVARQGQKIIAIDSFAYNLTIGPVPSTTQAQGIIQIQSDSDFVLIYMQGVGVVNNAIAINPNATVQIQDTGSGKTFFNQPTQLSLSFGNTGFPFILPSPRVIAPNTNIKVDITNIFSAADSTYYFSFWGARVYYAD